MPAHSLQGPAPSPLALAPFALAPFALAPLALPLARPLLVPGESNEEGAPVALAVGASSGEASACKGNQGYHHSCINRWYCRRSWKWARGATNPAPVQRPCMLQFVQ